MPSLREQLEAAPVGSVAVWYERRESPRMRMAIKVPDPLGFRSGVWRLPISSPFETIAEDAICSGLSSYGLQIDSFPPDILAACAGEVQDAAE